MPPIPELAFIAVIAAFWRQSILVLDRIRGVFVHRTTLRGQIARSVADFLLSEARVIRWGDALIESTTAWVRPENRVREVAYDTAPGKPLLAIWNGRPVVFRRPMDGSTGNGDATPSHDQNLILMNLRGFFDITALTRAALDWTALRATTGSRFRVVHISGSQERKESLRESGTLAPSVHHGEILPGTRFLHWDESEIGPPKPKAPFDAYALGDIAAQARQDFQRWCQLKDWYLDRGIPWRRGHLLYGPPGTGKTALVRALAQEADMPVFAFDLSSMENLEFSYRWRDMQESAPCIALIEDIDGVFHGRENVLAKNNTMRESLTFDCLLNAVGGIETADGVFIVVTTNRPELLDEALGRPTDDGGTTRPGRLDRAFCLPLPDVAQRRAIIARIVGDVDESFGLHVTDGMTAAQVTEWAVSTALSQKWN